MRTIDVGLTGSTAVMRDKPHGSPITGLEWSPDGTVLATSSYDGTVKLWDAQSGQVRHTLRHSRLANSVRWSHDGRWVATSSADRTARVWDAGTGELVAVLARHADDVNTMAWSPDDTVLVTVAEDGVGRFWHVPSGELAEGMIVHEDHCMSVDWNPASGLVASCGEDSTIRLWDGTGTSVAVWPHETDLETVRWSPDGTVLAAACDDGFARIYTPAGECTATIGPVATAVKSISWSPCGRYLAVGAYDSSCTLWHVASNTVLVRFEGCRVWARSVGWSPDGRRIAIGSLDGAPAIVEVPPLDPIAAAAAGTGTARSEDAPLATLPVPAGPPTYGINSVAVVADGGLVLGGDDGVVRYWELTGPPAAGREHAVALPGQAPGQESLVNTVAVSPRLPLVAYGTFRGVVRVRDRRTGTELASLDLHAPINQVGWNPERDTLVIATYDGEVVFADLTTGGLAVRHRSVVVPGAIKSVVWLDADTVVVGATDRLIRVVSTQGEVRRVLAGHGSLIDTVSVTSGVDRPLLASTSRDRTVRVWDLATGRCEHVLFGHDESLKCASWKPGSDTVLLSGGYDYDARLWDLSVDPCDGRFSRVLEYHRHGVGTATWWRGQPVTASWDGSCVVWSGDDHPTPERVLLLSGAPAPVPV